jgi:uncharacterized protein YqjF (DUF2071 family)
VRYRSRRTGNRAPAAEFIAHYRPTGEIFHAEPRSLDHFLTERYCLYTVNDSGRVHRAEIHHRPWPLQPAEADIRRNTMGEAAGMALPPQPHHCTYSRRLDVVIWTPERAG